MENKKKYIKPSFSVKRFSVKDVIHASGPVPCPAGDICSQENGGMSLDEQILKGYVH